MVTVRVNRALRAVPAVERGTDLQQPSFGLPEAERKRRGREACRLVLFKKAAEGAAGQVIIRQQVQARFLKPC